MNKSPYVNSAAAMQGVDAPRPEPQVQNELERLVQSIGALEMGLSNLEERLKPVTRQLPPGTGLKDVTEQSLVPLAEQIRYARVDVQNKSARIGYLLETLEI